MTQPAMISMGSGRSFAFKVRLQAHREITANPVESSLRNALNGGGMRPYMAVAGSGRSRLSAPAGHGMDVNLKRPRQIDKILLKSPIGVMTDAIPDGSITLSGQKIRAEDIPKYGRRPIRWTQGQGVSAASVIGWTDANKRMG